MQQVPAFAMASKVTPEEPMLDASDELEKDYMTALHNYA
jgi:hypothetical protein